MIFNLIVFEKISKFFCISNRYAFYVGFVFTFMLQLLLRKARDLISEVDSTWHLDCPSVMFKCFDCLGTFLINQPEIRPIIKTPRFFPVLVLLREADLVVQFLMGHICCYPCYHLVSSNLIPEHSTKISIALSISLFKKD